MGADRAPKPEIEGAILAARHCDVRVLLVGQGGCGARRAGPASLPAQACPSASSTPRELIGMDEKAAQAVRAKRDSSMRVGLRLVRDGKAGGFVTAGNTGAAMATAKMVLGVIPGVDRPALATVFPTAAKAPPPSCSTSAPTSIASRKTCSSSPSWATCTSAPSSAGRFPTADNPRVGLLSIGEEETKGNDLTREAFQLIKAAAHELRRQRRRPRPLQRQAPTCWSATASSATWR